MPVEWCLMTQHTNSEFFNRSVNWDKTQIMLSKYANNGWWHFHSSKNCSVKEKTSDGCHTTNCCGIRLHLFFVYHVVTWLVLILILDCVLDPIVHIQSRWNGLAVCQWQIRDSRSHLMLIADCGNSVTEVATASTINATSIPSASVNLPEPGWSVSAHRWVSLVNTWPSGSTQTLYSVLSMLIGLVALVLSFISTDALNLAKTEKQKNRAASISAVLWLISGVFWGVSHRNRQWQILIGH